MSVEAFTIAALVDEGSPKKAFQAGIGRDDFLTYDEEWDWIMHQYETRRAVNWRRFQQQFPEFEKIISSEPLQDLCEELKKETSYTMFASALEQAISELTTENVVDQANSLREIIGDVLRVQAPHSDIVLSSDYIEYLKRMKSLQSLRANGDIAGIPTGIETLDHHWGGLQKGRVILVLGRPGDAKSFFQESMYVHGFLDGRRVSMFSPEMNEDEHRARIATLLTAIPEVQEELGITKAIRNRALMDGKGYNYKTLKRLWEWVYEQPGAMVLHTNKGRRVKMTPAFIEARVEDLGIEEVFIDPIYKLKPNQRLGRNVGGWEIIQRMTDEVCDMAESYDIPIVISNQAHRQQGNRGDAPHKDSSFGSDAPVQEADHVIGVKHILDENTLILRCTKNRFGEDFRVDVKFMPNIGVLRDMSLSKGKNDYYHGGEDGSDDKQKQKKAIQDLEKEMQHDPR